MLEIIYRDAELIAINKPAGLLVHRTKIAAQETEFAVQKLRDQIGEKVFPLHRLDRPTSGVLLFSLNKSMASEFGQLFKTNGIQKVYFTIVRGFLPDGGEITKALRPWEDETGKEAQEATTNYTCLDKIELPIPVSRYSTARYSLAKVKPLTGRTHQIRRHFAHLRHYIVGDKRHGERHHNKMFREKLNCPFMLLHARTLSFRHPATKEDTTIKAGFPLHWEKIFKEFDWMSYVD